LPYGRFKRLFGLSMGLYGTGFHAIFQHHRFHATQRFQLLQRNNKPKAA